MGIVNVTPDSFSDGGLLTDAAEAIEHARRLVGEGADIIDVGGESSRPGAEPVAADVEMARVIPVVEALSGQVRVSVDTAKAEVARAAVAAGATLVNDITASLHGVAAEHGVGWIAMHMRGEPRTMQASPHYEDVLAEVSAFLIERAAAGRADGLDEVWIDPGIGFGKTPDHNWTLLAGLGDLVAQGWPVAVGTSRKGFLGAALARADGTDHPTDSSDRLEASIATALAAAGDGVGMVRVHDVAATVAAFDSVESRERRNRER